MFDEAMLTDLKPHEFWTLSIREFFTYMECFYKKRKEQMDYDISIAWKTAHFIRMTNFPQLSEVIKPEVKPQTEQEMYETAKKLAKRIGGT